MSEVLLEKRPDGVALVTLNRPDNLNAMTNAMFEALGEVLTDCERDRRVRCVALTGAGRAFCAGGDVKAMAADAAADGRSDRGSVAGRVDRWTADLRSWQDNTVLKLHIMPKPAVALVNGHAVGAGFSLALACDLRLCSDVARFGTGFRNVGLSADFGMTYFLPRVVGGGLARELMFTAEVFDAQRALALGVANRVWPAADFMDAALAFCAELAAGPTAAFARMKENLNLAETAPLKAVLDQEAFFQRFNRLSSDHKEAVAAFVEKRSPVFRGE